MLKRIILAEDALDSSSWVSFDCENICEFLASKYERLPSNAKIYHSQVSLESDVTPIDEKGIKALQHLEGTFYVVMYPHEPMTIFYVFMVVIAAAAFLMTPAVPSGLLRNQNAASPNNELSQRENKPRLNGRIPDIFGTVSSTPDLIALTYVVYENHQEVEYAYMCIGKGDFDINNDEILDGDAYLAADGTTSSVEIYGPNTSPNSGDAPLASIGDPISQNVFETKRLTQANGQVLKAPNLGIKPFKDEPSLLFSFDAAEGHLIINTQQGSSLDFTDEFSPEGTTWEGYRGTRFTIGKDALYEAYVDNEQSISKYEFPEYATMPIIYSDKSFSVHAIDYLTGLVSIGGRNSTGTGGTLRLYIGQKLQIDGFLFHDEGSNEWKSLNGEFIITTPSTADRVSLIPVGDPHPNWAFVSAAGVQSTALDFTTFTYHGTMAPRGAVISSIDKIISVTANEMRYEMAAAYLSWPGSPQDKPEGVLNIASHFVPQSAYFSSSPLAPTNGKLISLYVSNRTNEDFIITPITYKVRQSGTYKVFGNIVARSGLYKDSGVNTEAVDVELVMIVEVAISINSSPSSRVFAYGTVNGDSEARSSRGLTIEALVDADKGDIIRVSFDRRSDTDYDFHGTVVDEIKLKDCYISREVGALDFGDVTTVQTKTYATEGALSLKNRKLNMLATRIIPTDMILVNYTNIPYFTHDWKYSTLDVVILENSIAVTYSSYIYQLKIDCDIVNLTPGEISFDLQITLSAESTTSPNKVQVYLSDGSNAVTPVVYLATGVNNVTFTKIHPNEPTQLVVFSYDKIYGKMFKVENISSADLKFKANYGDELGTQGGTVMTNAPFELFKTLNRILALGAALEVIIEIHALPSSGNPLTASLKDGGVDLANVAMLQLGINTITFVITTEAANSAIYIEGDSEFSVLNINVDGYEFDPEDVKKASNIIKFVSLDPKIGNRQLSEIDTDNLASTMDEVDAYFGSSKASEFNYTFDNSNLSFEETVAIIANAVHSIAYRRGHQIKLSFEKQTDVSTLLFNHRNKLPGSEVRTVAFGNSGNFDGVEYEYVDPTDDALVTMYLPPDQSAINPKKVESIGIRSKLQAHFHANRIWNKTQYQNTTSTFDCTEEADLLIIQDRVLVADGTRPNTQDGYVDSQNGLELTLSQSVEFEVALQPYVMFLQLPDGTVQAIGVTEGSSPTKVILSEPPTNALSLADDAYVKTAYVIVGNTSKGAAPFIVTEKTHNDGRTLALKGINYDDRYYANDTDFINAVVDEDGNIL